MNRPTLPVEALLSPLAALYAGVMNTRNFFYDHEWLSSHEAGVPVLSIGNLTAGGTGKTPVTAMLVEELTRRGIRLGIVSRGYGGEVRGVERVRVSDRALAAKRYGDEPTWFAERFPQVPVYVGPDRVSDCRALLSEGKVQLILADDAFQHRRLKRAMDVVIVDATEPQWHYRRLPLGRMRESFKSLGRAQAVFITKTNLASAEQRAWLLEQVNRAIRSSGSPAKVYELESVITRYEPLAQIEPQEIALKSAVAPQELKGQRIFLFSGIGRPKSFYDLVVKGTGAEVEKYMRYPDHHLYTEEDLAFIEDLALSYRVDAIVMTEKDAVKIAGWSPKVPCLVSRLETRPTGSSGAFYEFYEAVSRLVL